MSKKVKNYLDFVPIKNKNNILTLETPSSSYHITHLITPPNKFKITIYYNL